MLLAGGDGKVIDANRRACDLLRRTREELAGLDLEDLSDPSYPILGAALSELRAAGSATGGVRLLLAASRAPTRPGCAGLRTY